jgi:porphobilinogen synthase
MKRLQRLRQSKIVRDLCATTEFNSAQLIQPLFAVEGLSRDEEIPALRGVHRHPIEGLVKQVGKDLEAGVRNFILFNAPANKNEKNFDGKFSKSAIAAIKKEFGVSLHLWVDTCLCSNTSHGHCCVFDDHQKQDLPSTLLELNRLAQSYVEAGADGISPSDMNDGRTASIRKMLDDVSGGKFNAVPIMSYSTKFASQLYGPFRNAADSAPQFGDRTSYQIDVRNGDDALASSLRCAEEGADLLMVKPGMTSIDLIKDIKSKTGLPVGAYQTSGEYGALVLLEEKGLINFEKALLETWHVFKRAGTQYIITYGARYAKKLGVNVP